MELQQKCNALTAKNVHCQPNPPGSVKDSDLETAGYISGTEHKRESSANGDLLEQDLDTQGHELDTK